MKLFLLSLIPVGYRTEITAYPAVNFSLFSTSSHFFFPFTFDFFLYNNPKPHRESLPDGNIPTSLTDSSHAPGYVPMHRTDTERRRQREIGQTVVRRYTLYQRRYQLR